MYGNDGTHISIPPTDVESSPVYTPPIVGTAVFGVPPVATFFLPIKVPIDVVILPTALIVRFVAICPVRAPMLHFDSQVSTAI